MSDLLPVRPEANGSDAHYAGLTEAQSLLVGSVSTSRCFSCLPHEHRFNLDEPAGREVLNRMLAFLDGVSKTRKTNAISKPK